MLPRFLLITASITIVAGSSVGGVGQDTDPDPKFDGKKGSEWVRTLIEDTSGRKTHWRSMHSRNSGHRSATHPRFAAKHQPR